MGSALRYWRSAAVLGLAVFGQTAVPAQTPADWARVESAARGQTVYFNAWAGDATINRYIGWAGDEVQRRYGVKLVLVKVADIAETVTRIQAEKAAGRTTGGSVDLMWINGENFASLRAAGLLYGPWVDSLPNARLLDASDPTQRTDFTLPTAGLEMPWGGARFTLFYDSTAIKPSPPRDPQALLAWIRSHPGRFTYPQPPDFIGSSFLKQLLLLLATDPARLQQPVAADFDAVTLPLWTWLDAAHPHLWRAGRAFPRSSPEQRRLLGDGEVDWLLSFNPFEAARAIRAGELPASLRGIHFAQGALGNSHFLGIPFNTSASAGARVVANFLISPEAQARKADPAYWGDPAVLSMAALAPAERSLFRFGAPEVSAPSPGRLLPEPHPSWTPALERAWSLRYGAR
jgi:putative thiamine transport system substrate-binding protein